VGNIFGLGRGRENAGYALKGFNYLRDNPVINQAQGVGQGATGLLAGALGVPGYGGGSPTSGGGGGFNPSAYLEANPDVAQAFATNPGPANEIGITSPEQWAQYHYETHGMNEGRPTGMSGGASASGGAAGGSGNPAFDAFQRSTGYQARLRDGTNAITGSAATRGMLNSGATLKALNQFGQEQAQQSFNDYLGLLGGLSSQGLQAATAVGEEGTEGGVKAAKTQPETKGIFGRLINI